MVELKRGLVRMAGRWTACLCFISLVQGGEAVASPHPGARMDIYLGTWLTLTSLVVLYGIIKGHDPEKVGGPPWPGRDYEATVHATAEALMHLHKCARTCDICSNSRFCKIALDFAGTYRRSVEMNSGAAAIAQMAAWVCMTNCSAISH